MLKDNRSSIFKDTLVLTCITLAAGLLLGIVYQVTRDPIRRNELQKNLESYQKAFSDAKSIDTTDELLKKVEARQNELNTNGSVYGNIILNEILIAKGEGGEQIGYVISVTTHDGYGGDITLSVGIDSNDKITGMEITSMNESPGLGSKANDEPFKSQYSGKNASEFKVVKGASGENEIDAITGATITSNAVTNAVNEATASLKAVI